MINNSGKEITWRAADIRRLLLYYFFYTLVFCTFGALVIVDFEVMSIIRYHLTSYTSVFLIIFSNVMFFYLYFYYFGIIKDNEPKIISLLMIVIFYVSSAPPFFMALISYFFPDFFKLPSSIYISKIKWIYLNSLFDLDKFIYILFTVHIFSTASISILAKKKLRLPITYKWIFLMILTTPVSAFFVILFIAGLLAALNFDFPIQV